MKIAITAHGEDRRAPVDSRFGRADCFVLYDEVDGTWTAVANVQNLKAAHGAGIQAGQILAQTGARVLITGHIGPKAFKLLQAGQIAMYSLGEMTGSVEEALSAFFAGKLTAIAVPNALDLKK